jgi:hypothetical protein
MRNTKECIQKTQRTQFRSIYLLVAKFKASDLQSNVE